jgi:hypothetical protein
VTSHTARWLHSALEKKLAIYVEEVSVQPCSVVYSPGAGVVCLCFMKHVPRGSSLGPNTAPSSHLMT